MINLINLEKDHFEKLFEIVSNPLTMQWIGDGNPWSKEKLSIIINLSINDNKIVAPLRKMFYWVIVKNNNLIGLIYIRPYNFKISKNFYITSLLHPNEVGKGYGIQALNMVLRKFKKLRQDVKYIYIDTLIKNTQAQKTLNDFNLLGITKIHNRYHFRYVLLLKKHA